MKVSFLSLCHLFEMNTSDIITHWVDTWWANGAVSPSNMSVVDRLDLKFLDYIQSKAI